MALRNFADSGWLRKASKASATASPRKEPKEPKEPKELKELKEPKEPCEKEKDEAWDRPGVGEGKLLQIRSL